MTLHAMSYLVRIGFAASLEESSLVGRILNFKEELYREFRDHAGAEIIDNAAVDVALAPLEIKIRSKRFLTTVTECIRKASEHEGLQDKIIVTQI